MLIFETLQTGRPPTERQADRTSLIHPVNGVSRSLMFYEAMGKTSRGQIFNARASKSSDRFVMVVSSHTATS